MDEGETAVDRLAISNLQKVNALLVQERGPQMVGTT
jgi:hypothetical protein